MFHRILLLIACFVFTMQQNCHIALASSLNEQTHQEMQNLYSTYDLSALQRDFSEHKNKYGNMVATSWLLAWFVCPKISLQKEDIQALDQNGIKGAEGNWTIGDLKVVAGKEYLQSLQLLLVESARILNGSIQFNFQGIDSSGGVKNVIVEMKNINVKNPQDPLSQYLKNIIENPEGTKHHKHHAAAAQTVIVQGPPPSQTPTVIYQNPPPPSQTVIIKEHHSAYPPFPYPFYGPIWGPGIYIGREGHHHHR